MKKKLSAILLSALVLFAFTTIPDWKVPPKQSKKKNPVEANAKSIKKGAKLYKKHCVACHLADGTGLDAVTKVDFTSKAFQAQTDGDLYYKITEGREGTAMASYGDAFSPKNAWNIVNYLRTFSKVKKGSVK